MGEVTAGLESKNTVDDRLDHLHLALTNGVGPVLIERLLEAFGSASAVLRASPTELSEVPGVGVSLIREIRNEAFRQHICQLEIYCQQRSIDILLPSDKQFPRLLLEIPDRPTILFTRGRFSPADDLSIAIVGTRGTTQYGRTQAARFARCLCRAGLTIVSGLARGADAFAHQGALDAGGRTIAVLSNGVDEVYPPQNQKLAESIVQQGALISEMPPGSKPKRGMFPRRNRLISGLCLATIVIEAGERSGALITARLAGEQGREVFALPGLVTSPNSRGCHALIRDGATLIQDPEQVIDALGPLVKPVQLESEMVIRNPTELTLNDQETAVLQAISVDPTDINSVIASSGLPVSRVLSTLSVLEMRRLIRRIGGSNVQRI